MTLTTLLEAATKERTQSDLAKAAGVAQTAISAWVRGTSIPSRLAIPSLAAALGMPVDDLAALVARSRQGKAQAKGRRDHRSGGGRGHVRGSRRKSAASAAAKGER